MTKIAIIGNSHLAAVRNARDAISAAFPTLETTYFGLPGPRFTAAKLINGIFKAEISDPEEEKIVRDINGKTEIDLRDCDHILVVGQGFWINSLYPLVARYSILGMANTGQAQLISRGLLQAAMARRASVFSNQLGRHLGKDRRIIISQSPFPCQQIDPAFLPNHTGTLRHPDVARIAALWAGTIAREIARLPFGFLPVPDAVSAGPFLTKPQYARATSFAPDVKPAPVDYTHVNSEYGFEMFKAFVNQWLGLAPVTSPQTRKV